jgi:hypothetical protein
MGMFSYMCEVTGQQVRMYDKVRLYLLKEGQVVEEMRGHYNGYGSSDDLSEHHEYRDESGVMVPVTEDMIAKIEMLGDPWVTDEWNELVNMHFDEEQPDSGFACALECNVYANYIPKSISENDPEQGGF